MSRESSYQSLSSFLSSQTVSQLHMTFEEVAKVLGRGLPNSAFRYPAWWANNPEGHSHSRAWVEAGWKTEALDLSARKLTFRRASASAPPPGSPSRGASSPRIVGRLKGTITITGDLTEPSGASWNAERGVL